MVKSRGRLQVVATPIGNLNDLSPRARQALEEADVIAAEDTRHTLALLQAIGVSRPLLSLHSYNEAQRTPGLLARLEAGESVVLVSDAGTPLLSDPGFELVRDAARAGYEVLAIPGPSAITTALAVAGLPTSRFCFEGFLPARERERRARLAGLANETRTLVFFEAPHRIAEMLADLAAELGADRQGVVAREMTKTHETVYRGTLHELASLARDEPNFQRGELTVVVAGAPERAAGVDTQLLHQAVDLLSKELPPGRAAAIAAQLTGAKRSEVYTLITRAAGARGSTSAQAGPADRPASLGQVSRSVKDIKRSEAWYRDVLQLPHLLTAGSFSFFDVGGTRLYLFQPDSDPLPSESILYFKVADIQAAHQAFAERGIEFIRAPHLIHRHDDGTEEWMAFFKDPDGRPLAIQSRVEP